MIASEKMKQVAAPRRRAASTKRMKQAVDWSRVRDRFKLFSRIGVGLLALMLVGFIYREIVSSRAFQLRNIEVSGNHRVNSIEVERLVRQNLSGTLVTASLGKLQEQLETVTWIRRAQVTRILPDTLRIQVEEREPLVLARFQSQGLVWMDEDAVVLGDYDSTVDKNLPPLVFGFSRERTESVNTENLERVDLYKRLMWALDSGNVKYSEQVEEIDLSNLKDVRLQLTYKSIQGPLEVQLGDRDFRSRLTLALDVLDALRRRDSATLKNYQILDEEILKNPDRISFISVVHPAQVAIRLSKAIAVQTRPHAEPLAPAGEE
jgi:cell division septal protein FtsQ